MNYWKDRQSETLEEILTNADILADELSNLYAKSSFYLNDKIQEIFDKYRSKYGLSIQEAKILLNQLDDPTSYDEMLERLKTTKGKEREELLKKLESPAYRYRINRLQEAQSSIDNVMSNIYNQEKEVNTLNYIQTANASYYKTIFNIQKDIGIEFDFSNLNPKHIDTILKANWSGKNYSERIWNNTQELSKQVKEELLMGILTGKTEREMAQTINEKFQGGSYNARRLIQTESAYMSTMMNIEAYKEAGIDTMRFVAMHDLKTSKICQQHDGKYVKIKDAVVGSDVPPLHPNCRSFMVPVIDEELDKNLKRRVKDENGHYKIVDANETYDEWYKRMQSEKGTDTVEILKKKTVNYSSDRKQYYRYKDVLGDEFIPASLDKFQEMKYNDDEKWNKLKVKYVDVKLQNQIVSGDYNLSLREGQQGKHLVGHNNYIEGRSYIDATMEDIQKSIIDHAGRGNIERTASGKWKNQEIIVDENITGYVIDLGGNICSTHIFKIHYSKEKGTHMVPTLKGMRKK